MHFGHYKPIYSLNMLALCMIGSFFYIIDRLNIYSLIRTHDRTYQKNIFYFLIDFSKLISILQPRNVESYRPVVIQQNILKQVIIIFYHNFRFPFEKMSFNQIRAIKMSSDKHLPQRIIDQWLFMDQELNCLNLLLEIVFLFFSLQKYQLAVKNQNFLIQLVYFTLKTFLNQRKCSFTFENDKAQLSNFLFNYCHFLKIVCFSCEMNPQYTGQQSQLFYTNEFDNLTFNVENIILLTKKLDQVLKYFSYSFSNKTWAAIINKNIKTYDFLYWFVIDALYFSESTTYQVDRINYLRKRKISKRQNSSNWSDQFEEQKFITKMRILAMKQTGKQNLSEIKKTATQSLILMLQQQHQKISIQNGQNLAILQDKVKSMKDQFQQRLKILEIQIEQASLLFRYFKFQKKMIRCWIDQFDKKLLQPKCQVCLQSDKLIKCTKCELQLHPICYPKLGKNYTKLDFLCQNCQKNLDENTSCIFCPIKGGNFLEVENISQNKIYYSFIRQQNGLKLKFKKRVAEQQPSFIHLSCSLWHQQLEYNHQKGKLCNIHRVDRRKTQKMCYQCGTNMGVTIPCANQNCRSFYHPECATRIPLSTCIINAKNKVLIQLYCQSHRRLFIHQILKQNILSNLKQIKKLYQGTDHQIKRLQSANYLIDKKNKVQQFIRYDMCLYCRRDHQNQISTQPIINCWKCYNWYHTKCGNKCTNCQI